MKPDSICALCTKPGNAALSLIRLSGLKSQAIARNIAPFLPSKLEGHRAYVGVVKDGDKEIDQVVLTYFSKGRSFTGEDTFEFSSHGGRIIYTEILKTLIKHGARIAERGEFSFRAFLNGKMDLLQAEALQNLIESSTEKSKQQAFYQLSGRFSKKIQDLKTTWLRILSYIEADIDFSMEGLEQMPQDQLVQEIKKIQEKVQALSSSYRPFENLQKGLFLGIFGPSNSGKSSLFNKLLEENKSLVSSLEGTTRDVVEGNFDRFSLKDTAGLRQTSCPIEQMGQKKSHELFSKADLKILVLDSSKEIPESILTLAPSFEGFLVWTKKDISPAKTKKELYEKARKFSNKFFKNLKEEQTFFVSALYNQGLEDLKLGFKQIWF